MPSNDVTLAEYSALRAEILTHTTIQQGILTITVGLGGTLAGFAIDKGKPELLLALAPAALLLGAAHFEETRKIFVLAAYIRQVLHTRAPGLADWERSSFRKELGGVGSTILQAVVFAGGPLGAQIYVTRTENVAWEEWSWAATGVAAAVLAWSLLASYHARPTRQRPQPHVPADA